MDEKIVKIIQDFVSRAAEIIEEKDGEYNVERSVKDYFPKGWDSAYTYINENLTRLDSLHNGMMLDYKKIDEKWMDLLNYVLISYAVMKDDRRDEKEV